MKYLKKFFLLMFILLPCLSVCACTANNTENLAKDLDSTVKNLVISVSTLDWPADGDLESFNLLEQSSPSQTTSSIDGILLDTQIDTSEIYIWLENTHSKINVLFAKRGDLLLYLNEMYGGNTELSEDDILSLNVYMNILKDNSNYLNSYNGMLKNQINEAKEIFASNENVNLINAYLIKSVETLQLRCAKIDTSILAMTSIIDIIKNNLINNYFSYNEHEISNNNPENANQEQLPEQVDNETTKEEVSPIPSEEIISEEDTSTEENIDNNNTDAQNNTNNEIAINFDSETIEVDGSQELSTKNETAENNQSAEATDTNYDHLIKTLEEPPIDDNNEVQNLTNNIVDTKNTNSADEFNNLNQLQQPDNTTDAISANNLTENDLKKENSEEEHLVNENPQLENKINEENKDIEEIDKDFAQKSINNEENQTVTREIIKENIV